MKLFLLEQSHKTGYDTYDSAVVTAKNAEEAVRISCEKLSYGRAWPKEPEHVKATLIGTAVKGSAPGIVCSSFNAG